MKVLMYATYIYNHNHKECNTKNTGYGHMVNDIAEAVGEMDEVFLITDAISKGFQERKFIFLSHSVRQIIQGITLKNVKKALKILYTYQLPLAEKIREAFVYINKGYLKHMLQKVKPDIVQVHGISSRNLPMLQVCEELDIVYCVTLHGISGLNEMTNANKYDRQVEMQYIKKMCKKGTAISVVSSGVKKRLISSYNLPLNSNISVVLNGTKKVSLCNSEEKMSNENYHIMCLGNISVQKNQTQILEAYQLLPDKIKKNVYIDFFGKEINDISFANKVRKVGKNITYYGLVERYQLEKYWKLASLNILASYDEGFGLSIIEGYMHGVPSIFFEDIDAAKDLYNAKACIVVKERNVQALADAIIEAYNMKWDKKIIRKFGLKFSMNSSALAYHQFYEKAIKSK